MGDANQFIESDETGTTKSEKINELLVPSDREFIRLEDALAGFGRSSATLIELPKLPRDHNRGPRILLLRLKGGELLVTLK